MITEEEVRRVITLYKEAVKHYDNVIKEQNIREGYSQFAIDLLDGKIDIKELAVKYVLDEINKKMKEMKNMTIKQKAQRYDEPTKDSFSYPDYPGFIRADIVFPKLKEKIEDIKNRAQYLGDNAINGSIQQFYNGMKQGCVEILSFLDTLKVKGVDLNIEFDKYCETLSDDYEPYAEELFNFFELGPQVQKENKKLSSHD